MKMLNTEAAIMPQSTGVPTAWRAIGGGLLSAPFAVIVEFFPCLPWRVRVLGWMGMVAPAGTSPEISVDLNVRGLDDGHHFSISDL